MTLDKPTEKLIDILQSAGYEAYAVGGCVRDFIMGRPVNDYDITTSALPLQMEEVLEKNCVRYVETGLAHGTISAIIDGTPYEITTFRTEYGYSDGRHPDKVEFVTNLADDLIRRDFTINAMAYNKKTGVVDPFGGVEDIKNKIIRTVGNPDDRFTEDALRILRALRFSSTFDFDIEIKTSESILANTHLLSNVADERITTEMLKMINGPRFSTLFYEYASLFAYIFDLDVEKLDKHALESIADFINNTSKDIVYLVAFLTKFKNDEKFQKNALFGRLKLPSVTVNRTTQLVSNLQTDLKTDRVQLKLLMSELGVQTVLDIAEFYGKKECIDIIKSVISNNEPYLVPHLDVSGKDIMELGIKGKEIGNTLNKILKAVITEKVKNNKKDIINYIKKEVNH